ncbi:MAG: AAA family ATPase [Parachlamydiaceae bacterium]|nr:AAA family ATPase [Parachlamydiaceae bacterium]
MNNLNQSPRFIFKKSFLLLAQFFLIIFVYHTLKDLKDTVVITASSAGAEVIPFIKIWGMLPAAVLASYLFSKIYAIFGREKTLYIFVGLFIAFYITFAFVVYPFRDSLHLTHAQTYLTAVLPSGCRGLIAMICYWHYTLFYLSAELWSVIILAILFWGYVNETTNLEEAKKFYPLCMFTGNFAGIISGQTSYFLSHHLQDYLSWQETLQLMITLVAVCGLVIICINRWLLTHQVKPLAVQTISKKESSGSFFENLVSVCTSGPLLCIAILVIGFGLTSNLIEVVWKENIRQLHPDPQAYNAYINQITSLIGIFAVCVAFASRWLFTLFSWDKIALITPLTLFSTSFIFFMALLLPEEYLIPVTKYLDMSPIYLVVTLGSVYYILAMTAKYTIFDTTKEMAFLSVNTEEIMKAKSIIDSMGSRLGKTGASCLYQFLLITYSSTSGHLSVIGIASLLAIGVSIYTTKRLGIYLSNKTQPKVETVHSNIEVAVST